MRIPSHFKIVEISFFKGRFLSIGVITVGPVTMINEENKKDKGQLRPIMKWAAIPAVIMVTRAPTVISLYMTGPTLLI